MKRTWFAILFLLLVAGLCIFEQHTVKTTFENMETLLQSMDAAAAEENYPEAERKAFLAQWRQMTPEQRRNWLQAHPAPARRDRD